jgi:hypothetical protein
MCLFSTHESQTVDVPFPMWNCRLVQGLILPSLFLFERVISTPSKRPLNDDTVKIDPRKTVFFRMVSRSNWLTWGWEIETGARWCELPGFGEPSVRARDISNWMIGGEQRRKLSKRERVWKCYISRYLRVWANIGLRRHELLGLCLRLYRNGVCWNLLEKM